MSDFDCATCHDTGYVCEICDQPDGECTCSDGPELMRCTECNVEPSANVDRDGD